MVQGQSCRQQRESLVGEGEAGKRFLGWHLPPHLREWASIRLVESGRAMHLFSYLYKLLGIPIKPPFHIKTSNSLFPEGICLVREQ